MKDIWLSGYRTFLVYRDMKVSLSGAEGKVMDGDVDRSVGSEGKCSLIYHISYHLR